MWRKNLPGLSRRQWLDHGSMICAYAAAMHFPLLHGITSEAVAAQPAALSDLT